MRELRMLGLMSSASATPAFFVPNPVLAGGGSCSLQIDTYTQLNIEIRKPSFRGRASFCGLSVP